MGPRSARPSGVIGVDAPWMPGPKQSIVPRCPTRVVGSGPVSTLRRFSGGRPSSIHRAGSDRTGGTSRCFVRDGALPGIPGNTVESCVVIGRRAATFASSIRFDGGNAANEDRRELGRRGADLRIRVVCFWADAAADRSGVIQESTSRPQWTSVPFATAASGPRSVMPPDAASAPSTRTSLFTPAIIRGPRSVATTTWRPTSASGV